MQNYNNEPLEKLLKNSQTSSIFVFLRTQNKPLGVREIQRGLDLANPSIAHWHLNKLLENNIVRQTTGNKYILNEPYSSIHKIPLSVQMDYYIFKGKIVPDVFFLLSFLSVLSFASILLLLTGNWIASSFIAILGLLVTIISIFKFYFKLSKTITEKENHNE